MNKIFIIDAVNYLFRSYYAIGPMTNDKGQSTSALYGFIRSIQKLIKDFSPTHIAVVFDGPDNKKSRQTVYAEYKMHRKGAPEDLFPQFDWAWEFCELAGLPTFCVEGVEADDTMATIAVWAKKQNAQVFLCTSDKDLMQLVDDRVCLLQTHKDNLIVDAAKVNELYNVRPDQMLDLLAIMGDSSDNIPGLEGFGPKTASSLLQEFGTLDEILAHPEKVKGEKKQQVLRDQKEIALMSRQLATLDTAVDIPKDEKAYQLKAPDQENLAIFYRTMTFNSLLRDLGEMKVPKKCGARHTEKHDYHLVDTEEDLEKLLQRLSMEKEICIDTETTSERPLIAELVGVGFSMAPGEAWYVPCNGELGKERVLQALRALFACGKALFYGHNLKYDWHVLQNEKIELGPIAFDTILASYVLNPHKRRHNLDELALEYFRKVKIPIETLLGKGKQKRTMREAPIPDVTQYCCEDADYTSRLKEQFVEELEERKLERLFYDTEMPLLPILARMERRGIYLDVEELAIYNKELVSKIEQLRREIHELAGEEFNLNSPQQLSQILYEKLALQPAGRKKTETGTGAEVLEHLASQHAIVPLILNYRTLEKLRSTYTESLPLEINPKTGRIHCTFNQSVTATGRLSCQDPNLQNIPVRGIEGQRIRACFKPQRPNWSYLGADYSQIELRLLAHFSEDPELLKAFRHHEDIHTHTASVVFGIPIKEVSSEMRSQAKAVNFGILYGQGAYGLSQQTGLSFKEASEFIKAYFERYPKVSEYIEFCKEEARKTGVARTLTGRERLIPEIKNKNPLIRTGAERLAVNTPLQGTAADLIKLAMIAIEKSIAEAGLQAGMILQIHDELVFEHPDSETDTLKKIVKEKMEHVFELKVPIEVTIGVGKNWAEY